jgi:hypothetical protein
MPVFGALPTKYTDYNIIVKINENRIIEEEIYLTFPENIDKFNMYLIHRAKNLEVFAGEHKLNCNWKDEMAGTLVSCDNFNSSVIHMKFNYVGLVVPFEDFNVFSDRYIITTPTDHFNLKVFLPKGYILYESTNLENPSYFPTNGVQKTDGKIIYIEWNTTPKLGEVYDVDVYYEKALRTDQFAVVISTLVILITMILLFIYFRRQPKIIDLGLTEDEKRVYNIISEGDKISQKKIVRMTGLSKAQVSRIAKSLESRGLIERKRVGRNYEIVLKR